MVWSVSAILLLTGMSPGRRFFFIFVFSKERVQLKSTHNSSRSLFGKAKSERERKWREKWREGGKRETQIGPG